MQKILLLALLAFLFGCKEENKPATTQPTTEATTPSEPEEEEEIVDPTFTDNRDGKTYKIVKIGKQIWFAENLNFVVEESKCYDNNIGYCDVLGRLYDWKTSRKVCPSGWHLPNNNEWDELVDFVNGKDGKESSNKKDISDWILKAKKGWNNNGNGADKLGFAALPAGSGETHGGFTNIGIRGSWWTSTENTDNMAYFRFIWSIEEGTSLGRTLKKELFSVRCVKNKKII